MRGGGRPGLPLAGGAPPGPGLLGMAGAGRPPAGTGGGARELAGGAGCDIPRLGPPGEGGDNLDHFKYEINNCIYTTQMLSKVSIITLKFVRSKNRGKVPKKMEKGY